MAVELTWAQVALSLGAAMTTGGIGMGVIDWLRNRRKDRVDVASSVITMMEKFSQTLQAATDAAQNDAREAQNDAKAAYTEAAEARKEAARANALADETMSKFFDIRQQAETLAYRLRRLTGAILDENVSRGELIVMANEMRQTD